MEAYQQGIDSSDPVPRMDRWASGLGMGDGAMTCGSMPGMSALQLEFASRGLEGLVSVRMVPNENPS